MTFNIESYFNSLPKDIETIYVSEQNLNYLPSLSRFTNLEILYCSHNNLTSLPPLPDNLKRLFCNTNKLTSLPPLPEKLEELFCYRNKLTSLPPLPEKLEYLCCFNNPISEIINGNNTSEKKKQIQILNNFRHLHYSLKFKKQFRHLLWVKIREPKIMEKYHPDYLIENLHEETDLDAFLDNWL
jgi:Leucine-rich repeat (LRR) protein